jgi:hypothetical protein
MWPKNHEDEQVWKKNLNIYICINNEGLSPLYRIINISAFLEYPPFGTLIGK